MNIVGKVCSGVTISMIFNIIINNIMRLWARFGSNLYKDESYLTHTLPIDKKTLYLSKTLTSIIAILTLFISCQSKAEKQQIKKEIATKQNATIINNQFVKTEIEKNQNNFTRPRFSPGFGDVSLENQKHFFNLLPCSKIGLSLMDTLIMAPEKSVTAFVGIYKNNH